MGETVELANFVAGLRYEDLAPEVSTYAETLLIDVVGAGLYGASTAAGRIALEVASHEAGEGSAPVWGQGVTRPTRAAAFVNGVQAHAFELDDYHPGGKLHASAVVGPAALAVAAGQPVSGRDLLVAFVAGHEAMVRASLAANAGAARERGWHVTGLVGPFGAAAAAGHLLGLSGDSLANAFGIAASCAGGLFAFSAQGAMTKAFHAGHAATEGVLAAQLAAAGFTGPTDVFEASDGFLRAVSDRSEAGLLTKGLGDRFEIMNTAIKPYSCCGSIHSSIDAALHLVERYELQPDDIEEITAYNAAVVRQQCGFEFRGDGGPLEAQMSTQYCLAVAVADRAVSLPQFRAPRLEDPQVRELAGRVRCEVDPELDAGYAAAISEKPARVSIMTKDGRSLERFVPGARGSTAAPFERNEAVEKFDQTLDGIIDGASRQRILDALGHLPSSTTLDALNEAIGTTTAVPTP